MLFFSPFTHSLFHISHHPFIFLQCCTLSILSYSCDVFLSSPWRSGVCLYAFINIFFFVWFFVRFAFFSHPRPASLSPPPSS